MDMKEHGPRQSILISPAGRRAGELPIERSRWIDSFRQMLLLEGVNPGE